MSPDLDKYLALAKAEGDQYSDDDLMRLWAAMEHLFARSVRENCPQVLAADTQTKSPHDAQGALNYDQSPATEESKP